MTEITVHTLGHTAAERQATLEALGAPDGYGPFHDEIEHYVARVAAIPTVYAHRVTCRMEANDPLALSAALNMASGAGGIGE